MLGFRVPAGILCVRACGGPILRRPDVRREIILDIQTVAPAVADNRRAGSEVGSEAKGGEAVMGGGGAPLTSGDDAARASSALVLAARAIKSRISTKTSD